MCSSSSFSRMPHSYILYQSKKDMRCTKENLCDYENLTMTHSQHIQQRVWFGCALSTPLLLQCWIVISSLAGVCVLFFNFLIYHKLKLNIRDFWHCTKHFVNCLFIVGILRFSTENKKKNESRKFTVKFPFMLLFLDFFFVVLKSFCTIFIFFDKRTFTHTKNVKSECISSCHSSGWDSSVDVCTVVVVC